jgi:hypothetical protein
VKEKELQNAVEILSHKMKNPIHAAVINLDVVRVKLQKTKTDKTMLNHLDIVSAEIQRLNTIVSRFGEYLKDPEKSRIDLKKFLSV